MRLRQIVVTGVALGTLCVPAHAEARDLSRDTLAADDGWAAYGTGTTGGSAADDAHVPTVTDRAGLLRALDGGSDTPKIIKIAGTIDADTDADGHHLDCADYATFTESAIYAENNAFHTPGHVEAADLVKSWNGTALHQTGTLFNGWPVDLLAIHNAYNSGSERDRTADVGWTPTLHQKIDSAAAADREVARGAGAGRTP
ncbi:hypothetical protein [Streptomyces sp. 3214.6]|uniref:hypothetical protein n=1 Tax=Streptomyces sp. 3214.6 TaxID=1882757 RepID=UPI00090B3D35|nr:hypothetical protein [Streptomyces sp. 3214.6]SHI28289.1 hypothetical protein SAMN05444521_6871 [Streptomyces sp. 3214.6]